jgi:hypothetical protein
LRIKPLGCKNWIPIGVTIVTNNAPPLEKIQKRLDFEAWPPGPPDLNSDETRTYNNQAKKNPSLFLYNLNYRVEWELAWFKNTKSLFLGSLFRISQEQNTENKKEPLRYPNNMHFG